MLVKSALANPTMLIVSKVSSTSNVEVFSILFAAKANETVHINTIPKIIFFIIF
ncbi:MAG: hypothetical protein JKY16_03760 [Lutibacter sp.]|nr:hypothetical protein [Lutibacter sp.]